MTAPDTPTPLEALRTLVTNTNLTNRSVMLRHGRELYGFHLDGYGKPAATDPQQYRMVLGHLYRFGQVTGHTTVDAFLTDLVTIMEERG